MNLKFRKNTLRCALLALCLATASVAASAASITRMRCEYQESPINIDLSNPRFTWNYSGNTQPKSMRLVVATTAKAAKSGKGDAVVYDSKIKDLKYSGARHIMQGATLKPFTRYYWQVIIYQANGSTIKSPVASFETSLLNKTDWHGAHWITDSHDKDYAPAPMLRKAFNIDAKIAQARLYYSAAAYAQVRINGQAVDGALLNPGYTAYDKRNLWDVVDVTELVKNGSNAISAVLGNGFYNEIHPVATWSFDQARWRARARFIALLRITTTDGKVIEIPTDNSWRTSSDGEWRINNIYAGDFIDANKRIAGWQDATFDDSAWAKATLVDAPSQHMNAQKMPHIAVERELKAVDVQSWGDTLYVYNFGENITGRTILRIKGEKGTRVSVQHGEIQRADGTMEMGNIDVYYKKQLPDVQFQTDVYILDGNDDEFAPAFNYHGFQYVSVRADRPITIDRDNLTAQFFHTAVVPVGDFSCSNEMFNKLWRASRLSYLGNLMSIPTDCPQREKNGWTADAHISQDLGLMNYDGITFYEKWIDDITDNITPEGRVSGIIPSSGWGYDDWIGPVWDAAIFIVPMNVYRYYGDATCLERVWNTCERYLQYLANREDADGTVTYGIGDWVYYKTQTPTEFTTTCYYYLDNKLMAEFARILGKDDTKYANKASQLLKLINTKYLDREKCLYSTGTQAAQGVALYLDIVPPHLRQRVADNLAAMIEANGNYLDCGMLGSKTILRMLTKYGHADQAYEIASKKEAPAWGNWIEKGLTALPETWKLSPDFRDASLNHVFLGDISAWMVNDLVGIKMENKGGIAQIVLEPHFVKGLDHAQASYNSVHGMVKASWTRNADGIDYNVTVPSGVTAILRVNGTVKEIGQGEHKLKF